MYSEGWLPAGASTPGLILTLLSSLNFHFRNPNSAYDGCGRVRVAACWALSPRGYRLGLAPSEAEFGFEKKEFKLF